MSMILGAIGCVIIFLFVNKFLLLMVWSKAQVWREHNGADRNGWQMTNTFLKFDEDHQDKTKMVTVLWAVQWPLIGWVLLPWSSHHEGGTGALEMVYSGFDGRFPARTFFLSHLPLHRRTTPQEDDHKRQPDWVDKPNWLQTHLGV